MGLMYEFRKWGRNLVPDGVRRPVLFFRCIYVLDTKEWKTAGDIAFEAGVPVGTAMGYLRTAYANGLIERKQVPSRAYGGGKVYAYRLNRDVRGEQSGEEIY
jgi:predicted transcriptional regulator